LQITANIVVAIIHVANVVMILKGGLMKFWFPIFGDDTLCRKWMVCAPLKDQALKAAKKFFEALPTTSKPHYYPQEDWVGGLTDVQLIDTRKEIIKLQ